MAELSLYLMLNLRLTKSESSSVGTEFYFVFPPQSTEANWTGNRVIVTNPTDLDAVISFNTSTIPIAISDQQISARKHLDIDLPLTVYSSGNSAVQQNGIYIQSTNGIGIQVTVYAQLKDDFETFTVFPISAAGLRYDVIAPVLTPGSRSFVSIVTKDENTTLNIKFGDIEGVVALNNLQPNAVSYQPQAGYLEVRIPAGSNVLTLWYDQPMTGLSVTSEHTIAVFSGCHGNVTVFNNTHGSFTMGQVPPSDYLGYQYLVNMIGPATNNSVIILAIENTTVMSYDIETCYGVNLTTSAWFFEEVSSPLMHIVSSKPILVAHILGDLSFSMYYATPLDSFVAEVTLPPGNEIVVVFTCSGFDGLRLNGHAVSLSDVHERYFIADGDGVCSSSVISVVSSTSGINVIAHDSGVVGGFVIRNGHENGMLGIYSLGGDYFQRNQTCNDTQSPEADNCTYIDVDCPYYAPVVIFAEVDMEAYEGENVSIQCLVDAYPIPTIQWIYNYTFNNDTALQDKFTITTYTEGELTNSTLTISDVDYHDSKTYECRAENREGNGSLTVSLLVRGDLPVLRRHSFRYHPADEGANTRLSCYCWSTSEILDFYWTTTSDQTALNMTGSKYKPASWNPYALIITNVTVDDTGVYNCHCTNYYGTSKGQDILVIVNKVTTTTTTTKTTTTVAATTTTATTTTFDGNPTWSVNISVGQTSITAFARENKTLSCAVTGFCSSIYWEKTHGGLAVQIDVAASPSRTSGSNKSNPSLTLYNVSVHDDGVYRCVAKNSESIKKSEPITLKILDQSVATFVYVPTEQKQEYQKNKTSTLKKELFVDKTKLSSTVRLKTSAPDARPSAAATGALGIVMLTITFGTLLVLDFPVFVRDLSKSFLWEKVVKYCKTLRTRLRKT